MKGWVKAGGEGNFSPRTPLNLLWFSGTDSGGRRQVSKKGRGSGGGSPSPGLPAAALAFLLLTAGPLHAAPDTHRSAALAATRGIAPVERAYPDCPPFGVTVTEWRDALGQLRHARLQGGGDDSAFTAETFFDSRGRPRLAVVTGGAVSGARLTQRITIAPDGRRVSETRRVTEPGYTFPHPWPDALLPLAPARPGICPTAQESEHP